MSYYSGITNVNCPSCGKNLNCHYSPSNKPYELRYSLCNIPNVWGFTKSIDEFTIIEQASFICTNHLDSDHDCPVTRETYDKIIASEKYTFPITARENVIKVLKISNLVFDILGYIPIISILSGLIRMVAYRIIWSCLIQPAIDSGGIKKYYAGELLWMFRGMYIRGALEMIPIIGQLINLCLDLAYANSDKSAAREWKRLITEDRFTEPLGDIRKEIRTYPPMSQEKQMDCKVKYGEYEFSFNKEELFSHCGYMQTLQEFKAKQQSESLEKEKEKEPEIEVIEIAEEINAADAVLAFLKGEFQIEDLPAAELFAFLLASSALQAMRPLLMGQLVLIEKLQNNPAFLAEVEIDEETLSTMNLPHLTKLAHIYCKKPPKPGLQEEK